MLDRDTVDSLARGLVEIIDEINAFYENPETEAAYQRWLDEKYGDSRNDSRIPNSPPDKKDILTTECADTIKKQTP